MISVGNDFFLMLWIYLSGGIPEFKILSMYSFYEAYFFLLGIFPLGIFLIQNLGKEIYIKCKSI